jgi:hypothetical protein
LAEERGGRARCIKVGAPITTRIRELRLPVHCSDGICTFIPAKCLSAPENGFFDLVETRTFDDLMEYILEQGIRKKKDQLLNMYVRLKAEKDSPDDGLENLPWPEPKKVEKAVPTHLKAQRTAGVATGFSIGESLIVTAAHTFEGLQNEKYFAVFGYTHAIASSLKIPTKQVFELKR